MTAKSLLLLSKMQSIQNKLDELDVWDKFKCEMKETCLLDFTETWLSELAWDKNLWISGFGIPFRLDQSQMMTNIKGTYSMFLHQPEVLQYCRGSGENMDPRQRTVANLIPPSLLALRIPAAVLHECLHISTSQWTCSCTADCWCNTKTKMQNSSGNLTTAWQGIKTIASIYQTCKRDYHPTG